MYADRRDWAGDEHQTEHVGEYKLNGTMCPPKCLLLLMVHNQRCGLVKIRRKKPYLYCKLIVRLLAKLALKYQSSNAMGTAHPEACIVIVYVSFHSNSNFSFHIICCYILHIIISSIHTVEGHYQTHHITYPLLAEHPSLLPR